MMKSPYFGMQESIIRKWRKIATLGRLCQRIKTARMVSESSGPCWAEVLDIEGGALAGGFGGPYRLLGARAVGRPTRRPLRRAATTQWPA